MFILDDTGALSKYLGDPGRKIPSAHLEMVCKKNQSGACRYLALTALGWICAKNTPVKNKIDEYVAKGVIDKNTSDNCDGFGTLQLSHACCNRFQKDIDGEKKV